MGSSPRPLPGVAHARALRLVAPVLAVTVLAGCGTSSPRAVDPALRQSASTVAGALSDGDIQQLRSVLVDGGEPVGLSDWYRGRTVSAEAYESTDDPALALAMFQLACGSRTVDFWLQFRFVDKVWRLVQPVDDATTHAHC